MAAARAEEASVEDSAASPADAKAHLEEMRMAAVEKFSRDMCNYDFTNEYAPPCAR